MSGGEFFDYRLSDRDFRGSPIINGLEIKGKIINAIVDGEVRQREQLEWKRKIATTIKNSRKECYRPDCDYGVSVTMRFKAKKQKFDVENYIKPILDGVAAGVFCGEEQIIDQIPRFNFPDHCFSNIFIQKLDNDNDKDEAIYVTIYKKGA